MLFVLLANQLAMLLPKMVTTPMRRTAMSAIRRPYSVTAIPESSRAKRRRDAVVIARSSLEVNGSKKLPGVQNRNRGVSLNARSLEAASLAQQTVERRLGPQDLRCSHDVNRRGTRRGLNTGQRRLRLEASLTLPRCVTPAFHLRRRAVQRTHASAGK